MMSFVTFRGPQGVLLTSGSVVGLTVQSFAIQVSFGVPENWGPRLDLPQEAN